MRDCLIPERSLFVRNLDWGRQVIRREDREVKDSLSKPKHTAPGKDKSRGATACTTARRKYLRNVSYCTLTSICFGFVSSFFGKVNLNTPSLNFASIAVASTLGGNENDR